MSNPKRLWIEIYDLSPHEHFVCRGLIEGLSYKEIASILDITENSARATAKNAMRKVGVNEWQKLARVYTLMSEIAKLVPNRLSRPIPKFARANQ